MNQNRYLALFAAQLKASGIPEDFARKHLRSAVWACLWAVMSETVTREAVVQELKRRLADEKMFWKDWEAKNSPEKWKGYDPNPSVPKGVAYEKKD